MCSKIPVYTEEEFAMTDFALSAHDYPLPPGWDKEKMTDKWILKISAKWAYEQVQETVALTR